MTRPALKITHIDWAINLRTKRITTEFSIIPLQSEGLQRLKLKGRHLKLVSITLNERRLLPDQDYHLTTTAIGQIQVELTLETTSNSSLIIMTELLHHVKGNVFLKADELTLIPQGLNDLVPSRTTIVSDIRSHRNTIAPGTRQTLSFVQNMRKQIIFATTQPESLTTYGLFAGTLLWDTLRTRTQEGDDISLRVGVTHARDVAKLSITLVYMEMALKFLKQNYNLSFHEREWTLVALEPQLLPLVPDINSNLAPHTDVLAAMASTPWHGITAHSPSFEHVAKTIAKLAAHRVLKENHRALVILQPALVAALAEVLANEFVKVVLPSAYNRIQYRRASTSELTIVENIHSAMGQQTFGRLIQHCLSQTYECSIEDFETYASRFNESDQGIFHVKYQKLCQMFKANHHRALPDLFEVLEKDDDIRAKVKAMQEIALQLMKRCYHEQQDGQSNDIVRLCRYLKLFLTPQSEARDTCAMLKFPSKYDLYDAMTSPSMARVAFAHNAFIACVSTLLTPELLQQYQFLYQGYQSSQGFNHFDLDIMYDCEQMHLLLKLLAASSYRASNQLTELCVQHFREVRFLPIKIYALNALCGVGLPEYPSEAEQQQWWQRCDSASKIALNDYLRKYRKTHGRLIQAFAILSQGNSAYIVQDIKEILLSEYFDFKDPAHVRNLIVAFAQTNFACHQYYLGAYELLFQVACALDIEHQQPLLAIEVITPLIEAMAWLDQNRRQAAQTQMQKLYNTSESLLVRDFIETHGCVQHPEVLDEVPALTAQFEQMRMHQAAPAPQRSVGTALTAQKLK